jgi:apolipoprotein N-acyltransferase
MKKNLLVILSSLFLIFSFPGFNIWILAWVAFVPLFFAMEGQSPLKSFLMAYLSGFLFFLGTMYWLVHVTLPGMIIVVAYLAVYFGLFGLIFSHNSLVSDNKKIFLIPAAWASLEWLRAHALTGFGWNLLGYSQGFNLPAIQVADITGAYGVGFVIMMFNTAVYIFIRGMRRGKDAYIAAAFAVITLLVVFGYGTFRLNNIFTGEKMRVALVQGNIPQDQKWDERFVGTILSKYESLTKEAAVSNPDLIIWPETSIPGFVENEQMLASYVKNLVSSIQIPLLAGAPRYGNAGSEEAYYNTAFLFLKDASLGGRYDKVHLVPFGEYVPLKGFFFFVHKFAPRPIGDFTAGNDFTVLKVQLKRESKDNNYNWKLVKNVRFSPLICFEDIFPDLARGFVRNNIDFLVNMTNDAWFGRSSAAYQHAQASIFRAVENRINVLRAANTGLSCFIDQKGRITTSVSDKGKDLFVSGYKVSEIILSRARTVYSVYGDIFAYACMLLTAFYAVAGFKRRS